MFGTLQTKLIIAAVAMAIVFGGGWKLRDYQAKADALEAANAQLEAVKTALVARDKLSAEDAAKSKTLEEVLASMRESKTKIQIVREKEYVAKTVYASCIVPDSGLQLLNSRINIRNRSASTGEREGALPSP